MAGADDAQLKDFQGLPIQSLIIDPLVASAKGQRDLAMVTLDFVNEFGFEEDPDTKKLKARTVDVEIERLIEGKSAPLKQTLKMPLISMVTIPNLSIQDVEIDFTMEVKSHTANTSSTSNTQVDGTTNKASGVVLPSGVRAFTLKPRMNTLTQARSHPSLTTHEPRISAPNMTSKFRRNRIHPLKG